MVERLRGPNKENQGSIKKTRKAVNPSLDTSKLCASKYYIERLQGQSKNGSELGKT